MPGIKVLRGRLSQAAGADPRVRRSRAALTTAFTELAFERGYQDIGVRDVADRAAVGRSTLYSHFSDMNDLLAHSLDTHLGTLARCTVRLEMEPDLVRVIAHFWQQRSSARTMLQGQAGAAIACLLVRHLETALLGLYRTHRSRPSLPASLLAEQLAAGQIAVLATWLAGRAAASPEKVAQLLHRTSYAAAMASLQSVESARLSKTGR
ncbi:hypothetical protein GCM10011529_24110 [Polymorphobacter glacialis]|uniref:HTH tetR-type domain-containing protein n=1 Tax=Sandarakinorhabdus glacialis TaxID=1614636 RepID=A0A916ZWD2_9SPHN|nr:TetR/AcrR family transcriptional regulator [Polymorphobacter glacialis]GGE16848.1 hypothetical protein GCM10011529_24110 [Polymorphobacter glacialis]